MKSPAARPYGATHDPPGGDGSRATKRTNELAGARAIKGRVIAGDREKKLHG